MAKGKKGKREPRRTDGKRKPPPPPSPPSKDFGDSEYSEEVSSEYDRSPTPVSLVASSEDLDDSMGLSVTVRVYWRSIERVGLGGSDESEEVEDSSDSEEWSGGEVDGGEGDGSSGDDDDGDEGSGDSGKGDDSGDNGDDKGDGKGGDDDVKDGGGGGKASGIMLSA
jgi:hypothetical protein